MKESKQSLWECEYSNIKLNFTPEKQQIIKSEEIYCHVNVSYLDYLYGRYFTKCDYNK